MEFVSKWSLLEYDPNSNMTLVGTLGALVHKQAVLPIGKPLQSRFFNREHESGTKGPSFSPGFSPGTKGKRPLGLATWAGPLVPVGITNRD